MPGLRTATAGECTVRPIMRDGTPIRGTTEDIGIRGITIHSGTEAIMARHIGADGMTLGTVRGETRGTMTTIIGITTTAVHMVRGTAIRSSTLRSTGTGALRFISVQGAQPADSQAVRPHP